MQKLTFFLELVTYSLPEFRRSFCLLFCQLSTLLLRFLLDVDESKLGDVEDVSTIDAAAATAADDDVVADPSAAEMSESRVSVRSVEETVVATTGCKIRVGVDLHFSSSTRVPHVIESDVTYASYFALPHRKAAEEAGGYSRVA